MTEFIGLKAKMYALKIMGKSDTKRIKSIKRSMVAKTIMFEDFARCLNESSQQLRRQACVHSLPVINLKSDQRREFEHFAIGAHGAIRSVDLRDPMAPWRRIVIVLPPCRDPSHGE
ncbi:hypothetical protein P5V15_004418 [Pogonomyrmex californicus]